MTVSKPVLAIVIIIFIALVIVCPFITIWALNTLFAGVLFSMPIPFTMYTWLAVVWISIAFASSSLSSKLK